MEGIGAKGRAALRPRSYGRALGLLGDTLDLFLGLLGLLLGFLHEVVACLAHHLVLLGGLGHGEPDARPETHGQSPYRQRVLPQHPPEPAAGPPGLVTQAADTILSLADYLARLVLGLAGGPPDPVARP